MDLRRRSLLSATLLVTAAMVPMRAKGQPTRSIVGTWKLLSLYDEENGNDVGAFGPTPNGRLRLDGAQFFSFIILTSTPLASPKCSRSTTPITGNAAGPGTIACYGSYVLREHNRIYFHIEHGLTEGWKDAVREATFGFDDNKLSLVSSFNSLTGSDYSHLTWERICD